MNPLSDRYHKWLGIPPNEQPPNHYRLLGISNFESDREVIRNAVDQRMVFLRTIKNGAEIKIAQELLNQISKAKICLLDESEKQAYDAFLRQSLRKSTATETETRFDFAPTDSDRFTADRIDTNRSFGNYLLFGITAVTITLFIVVVVVPLFTGGKDREGAQKLEKQDQEQQGREQDPQPDPVDDTGNRNQDSSDSELNEIGDQERNKTESGEGTTNDDSSSSDLNEEEIPGNVVKGSNAPNGNNEATSGENPSDVSEKTDDSKPSQSDPVKPEPRMAPAIEDAEISSPVEIAKMAGSISSSRDPRSRSRLLRRYGGTEETEKAVQNGLGWLIRNQQFDGSWSLQGPYKDGAESENKIAATSMATLAFLRTGATHRTGRFRAEVQKAVDYLINAQDENGELWKGKIENHRTFTHVIATNVLVELFDLTKEEAVRVSAQKAVDYAISTQNPKGFWPYRTNSNGNTSLTGWYAVALHAAATAGLKVPDESLSGISKYLDTVSLKGGTRYAEGPTDSSEISSTSEASAAALLSRQLFRSEGNHAGINEGVQAIRWRENVFLLYFGSRSIFNLGDATWAKWNSNLKKQSETQITQADERGSWQPKDDYWGGKGNGGRLYVTCLRLYTLQTYYSHPPLIVTKKD